MARVSDTNIPQTHAQRVAEVKEADAVAKYKRLAKAVAVKFIERSEALTLTGKKRDDAAIHYFVGAAMALDAAGDTDVSLRLQSTVGYSIAIRGFSAVVELSKL